MEEITIIGKRIHDLSIMRRWEGKMAITKPICDICGSTKSSGWMCQGAYQTCRMCTHDISSYNMQPMRHDNLKMLLEVFLRRGKGEHITFKDVHSEKSSFKLMGWEDIWRTDSDSVQKANGGDNNE